MTTITVSDLATSPQINSRRVAHDLIEWLAARGWVIVQGQIDLPLAEPRSRSLMMPGPDSDPYYLDRLYT